MIEFIKLLFLAKVILLTSEPVDIQNQLVLDSDSALVAVTTGSSIEIDVSTQTGVGTDTLGLFESFELLEKKFPAGSLKAELSNGDRSVVLKEINYSVSKTGGLLKLSSDIGVPKGIEFTRVVITTKVPLEGVTVSWRNHKK